MSLGLMIGIKNQKKSEALTTTKRKSTRRPKQNVYVGRQPPASYCEQESDLTRCRNPTDIIKGIERTAVNTVSPLRFR